MSNSESNLRIDYVEFPATDIEATKRFYSKAFGWNFEDYGPDYTSFHDGRLGGGFTKVDLIQAGGPLVVIYATDLEAAQAKVREAGGNIEGDVLEFPGGCRFHFLDPNGNRLSVWTDRLVTK
jgi:predicted enzyme related to lactoylglutathione lyase